MRKINKSSKVAFAGIMAALSFVFLYLGSVIWIFAYTSPIICGLIMMMVFKTYGKKYALTVFFSVVILSLLFLPDKEAGLVYAFYFGYYPLIKPALEKLKPKALSFFTKLIIFNAGIISSQLILIFVFGIKLNNELGKWGIPLFIFLFNLVFLVYEKLYIAIYWIYENKLERRIKSIFK